MINALITNQGYAPLWLELPGNRMLFATNLRGVGVNTPPSGLKCNLEGEKLSVKLWGDTELEKKVVSVLHDRYLSSANTVAELLLFMPNEMKEAFGNDIQKNGLDSYGDLIDKMRFYRNNEVTENFYFPLTVRESVFDEYGFLDDSAENEYDGRYAANYTDEIKNSFSRYTQYDEHNMVEYFDGLPKCLRLNSAQSKLKSMDWSFEEHDGELFGVVKVRLTEPLTESEKAELVSYISGQNSDGLGEGYEQREIKTDEGEIYVSFWNSGDDYFVYDQNEFDDYLAHRNDIKQGGMKL